MIGFQVNPEHHPSPLALPRTEAEDEVRSGAEGRHAGESSVTVGGIGAVAGDIVLPGLDSVRRDASCAQVGRPDVMVSTARLKLPFLRDMRWPRTIRSCT